MGRHTITMEPKKRWKKVLYEDQGVPDNYVDESFLDEMQKNVHIRTYHYWSVVQESGVVTQQICSVCLFVAMFLFMDDKVLSPKVLFCVSSFLTIIGYCIHELLEYMEEDSDNMQTRTGWSAMKTVLMFVAFSYGLSPILMTLTDTISTDTVYAMTAAMLLANLLFHDYGADAAVVSGALSLNAAIFASVCLASRLHTTWHAFTTVTLAVEVFALWPVLRRKLKVKVKHSQLVLTIILTLVTVVTIATLSTVAAVLLTLLYVFITFVCPAWLISLQPYKNNIYGPWDEAEIKD
ncbi:phosphatidylinositol N-acetylglucosaminyltransferase subunit C [Lingula anatina]|uniref:Phosphatidylinositol N-acetylglucosaminyltransferase subunit C n=1 Tax=Lingula anatina TaxID=7574 RepID=A0A1S3H843_LINAN|nr:phosphatidylinositol N-acetylglucosaminyltransferase subunit C [Lingula anatina]|eukprot:XP_013382168.1 phosphatidylinositol N-acetylglucosaminyltransferase subunit C [Lingula anatina]